MTDLSRVQRIVGEGADEGLHIGFVLSVRRGPDHIEWTFGDAAPGRPMTSDTLMMWASCTKAITGTALMREYEAGRLGLDDPVALHIPEFAQSGKQDVTIRHVLTHTAGLTGFGATPTSWDDAIEKVCSRPLLPGWTPGRRAGYVRSAGAFVLAEIVRRVDGRSFDTYVSEEIFEACGMRDSWMALTAERYAAYGDRIGVMMDTAVHPPNRQGWDTPDAAAQCIPGGSGRGPVHELSLFYASIPLKPETIDLMSARHRTGLFDESFKATMDWGLFVIPNNAGAPYDYGEHASTSAFGHGGYQSSVGFRDPDRDLAVAMLFNGTCGERAHSKRQHDVCTALYEDLGLV